jgi:hypothetical protein
VCHKRRPNYLAVVTNRMKLVPDNKSHDCRAIGEILACFQFRVMSILILSFFGMYKMRFRRVILLLMHNKFLLQNISNLLTHSATFITLMIL